jgi:hypothetical protein
MTLGNNHVGLSISKLLNDLAQSLRRRSHALFQHGHSSHRQWADRPRDKDDHTEASIFDSLSDEGPFRRLTDAEAHRRVIFAWLYYGCLATALLAVLIWH